MSARKHPPDMAKPQTWLDWGSDKAVTSGYGETKVIPTTSAWQHGISPHLIAAVAMHRQCHPRDPLPAQLQRQIARAWLDRAKGAP